MIPMVIVYQKFLENFERIQFIQIRLRIYTCLSGSKLDLGALWLVFSQCSILTLSLLTQPNKPMALDFNKVKSATTKLNEKEADNTVASLHNFRLAKGT